MNKWIYMICAVLCLASCGGGGGVPDPDPGDPDPVIPTPAAPQRGTGNAPGVDYDSPAPAGGTDWGTGVYTMITFISDREFDLYNWNNGTLNEYARSTHFTPPQQRKPVYRTPGITYDLHVQFADGSWVRYDLVEGQTTLEVK